MPIPPTKTPPEPSPLGSPTFGTDPDPLTYNNREAGIWSLPSEPPAGYGPGEDPGAILPPQPYDYAGGMLVGHDSEADAVANSSPHLLRQNSDRPRPFQIAHEATHRRFEPPFMVAINQSASGFTLLAPTTRGLHFIKVISFMVTLDVAGTLQFVQGDNAGLFTSPISGTINIGTAGGFVLPPSELSTPWLFTSSDLALGIFTVTGKAQGFAVCCNSPYDQ
jgi:hypothetical protein